MFVFPFFNGTPSNVYLFLTPKGQLSSKANCHADWYEKDGCVYLGCYKEYCYYVYTAHTTSLLICGIAMGDLK